MNQKKEYGFVKSYKYSYLMSGIRRASQSGMAKKSYVPAEVIEEYPTYMYHAKRQIIPIIV